MQLKMEEIEEYSDYWESPYLDEEDQYTFSIFRIYKLCLEPSLSEVIPYISKLLFFCLIFRIITQIRAIPKSIGHAISALCGILVFYCISSSVLLIVGYIVMLYILMKFTFQISPYYCAYNMALVCSLYLLTSEFFFPVSQLWYETRGQHMIATMKVISIAFDMKRGQVHSFPTVLEYAGYMLCPCNCLFGPWISFNSYSAVFSIQSPMFDIKWLQDITICVLKSLTFLTVSNCWTYYLIPDTWTWFGAYKEALSFRSSHYFVSFLSEAAVLTGGYGYIKNMSKRKGTTWAFEVTRPSEIEFPRSLAQVVIFWNIPIHNWLKNYVFLVCKPFNTFYAVIMTYVISSLLHGFNIKLASVLLSLGFYTFVEYKLRSKLCDIFNACVGARQCRNCEHEYKDHIYVHITNVMFSALAVFHLAYLGCLLENSADTHQYDGYWEIFDKWRDLNYASHLCLIFEYYIYKVI